MATTQTEFEALQSELDGAGVGATLETLTQQLRERKSYHELFEALKMQARYEIGLPLMYNDAGDELDEATRTKLEDGLLEACREVGMALLKEEKIREGWMYLRPVGDKKTAAEVLTDIEANESNLDELVEVLLHEGVDAGRGFKLVLDNYGTCNSITTFEGAMPQRTPDEQKLCATILVNHLHAELLASVKADIEQREGAQPDQNTLAELVANRDWMFGEYSYHVDTTHLSSVTRFARLLHDQEALRLALDMTAYGRKLNKQFQYEGDAPFSDNYPSHALYFQALLGENVDEAMAYFQEQANALDPYEHGTGAMEVYIDLLSRVGRFEEAIEVSINMKAEDRKMMANAPSLLELSAKAGNYDRVIDECRQHNDLLGFATGLLQAAQTQD